MPILDLHCHPSLKPYQNNKAGDPDHTFDMYEPIPDRKSTDVIKSFKGDLRKMLLDVKRQSQSNVITLADNDFRVAFAVIHPIERGWFEFRLKTITRALLKIVAGISEGNKGVLASLFTGIDRRRVNAFFSEIEEKKPIRYFDEVIEEYEFIRDQQNAHADYKFRIISDYEEYKALQPGRKETGIILTVEGGHSLCNVDTFTDTQKLNPAILNKYRQQILDNVDRIKGLQPGGFAKEHTPFFITLAHFYNNFLVGHAQSFFGGAKLLFRQKKNLDQGFSALGKEVLARVLKRSHEEKRILIDVKHMSYPARQEYYRLVADFRSAGDNIPVIFSHGAVAGISAGAFLLQGKDEPVRDGYFSHASINLFDEDLDSIIDSDGIIGLSPHEGRMPGKAFAELTKNPKRTIGFDDHRRQRAEDQLRLEYAKLFLSNILHIVNYKGEKAWDHICIGTDFDGIMDPFDSYHESPDMSRLMLDLKNLLRMARPVKVYEENLLVELTPEEVKKLLFGRSPDELIDKIAYKNLENFLSKYFTEAYRKGVAATPVIS